MKKILSTLFTVILGLALTMVSASCDQVEKVASGVGGGNGVASAKSPSAESPGSGGPTEETGVDGGEDTDPGDEPESVVVAQADAQRETQTIRLSAFTDFSCSEVWTNRDGGWGLRAGSGSGVCSVVFPGATGSYRITLMAQLEFDGDPIFRIDVDGTTIAAGRYPMSMGELICDCPNWRVNCPDRIVPIDAGIHEVRQGASIDFVATEVYPCGGNHGAYAKWHELVFTPQ